MTGAITGSCWGLVAAERNKGRACLPRTRSEEVGGETRQTDTSAKCHLPVCRPILTPEHGGGKATGALEKTALSCNGSQCNNVYPEHFYGVYLKFNNVKISLHCVTLRYSALRCVTVQGEPARG